MGGWEGGKEEGDREEKGKGGVDGWEGGKEGRGKEEGDREEKEGMEGMERGTVLRQRCIPSHIPLLVIITCCSVIANTATNVD